MNRGAKGKSWWPGTPRLRGLRSQMVVFFGIPFILIVVTMNYVALYGVPMTDFNGSVNALRSKGFEDLSLIADLKKERLELWIHERRSDATVLSESKFLQLLVTESSRAFHQQLTLGASAGESLDRLKTNRNLEALSQHLRVVSDAYGVYQSIDIVDADTGFVIASSKNVRSGRDIAGDLAFAKALDPSHQQTITVEESLEPDPDLVPSPRLIIAEKIKASTRQPAGSDQVIAILMMTVALDDLINPILQAGGGSGRAGETLLVDSNVIILTTLKHPLADGSIAIPLVHQITAKPAILAAAGSEGITAAEDYRGVKVLAAYRHIRITPELGWGLIAKRDQADVFESVDRDIRQSLIIGFLGALLIGATALLIASRLARPIRALESAVVLFGAGDRSARAVESGSGEIGRVTLEFNKMADTLLEREIEVENRSNELAAANRELEAFSYSVSHDLRAPLRAVGGFVRILERDFSDVMPEEARNHLSRVRAGSERMSELIEDLLTFSRLGRQELAKHRLSPATIAREVADELAMIEPQRTIEITVEELPACYADASMLRQVFVNLIGNAIKFTGPRDVARITVGSESLDGQTTYFVRDNGVGFDMRYVDRLFRVFQRLHSESEFEGTGVGLALVQRIIQRHGGTIRAEASDDGAAFFFTL